MPRLILLTRSLHVPFSGSHVLSLSHPHFVEAVLRRLVAQSISYIFNAVCSFEPLKVDCLCCNWVAPRTPDDLSALWSTHTFPTFSFNDSKNAASCRGERHAFFPSLPDFPHCTTSVLFFIFGPCYLFFQLVSVFGHCTAVLVAELEPSFTLGIFYSMSCVVFPRNSWECDIPPVMGVFAAVQVIIQFRFLQSAASLHFVDPSPAVHLTSDDRW